MNNTNENLKERLLGIFMPVIERSSLRWKIILGIFIFMLLFGVFALVMQIIHGHIITGMRDNVVWGVYIVNFIFFMGISYAGALISGVLHLFRSEWRKPILRMAELITVISLLIGPFFIMFCIGRLDRLPYLVAFPRIQSPITWDVIAISTDIVGCFIFLYLSFIEDIAILRDRTDLKVAPWRRKLYHLLSLGYTGTPEQKHHLKWAKDVMSAMIIAIAIIVYSVLAWIFGVTLQPGWHSTIFGPYFVIAAVFSGAGVLIVLMWIFRKVYHLEEFITRKHFVNVGVLLMVIALFYGYFTFSDYLTKWYGSVKMDKALIDKLFTEFYWLFILSNYVGILVPVIIIGIPKFRTINNITIGAIIAVLGLWVNRYLIIVPTLETPYLPIQDVREAWLHYSSTWIEWALTFGGIGLFGFLLMMSTKLVPIMSISEMTEEEHPVKPVEE